MNNNNNKDLNAELEQRALSDESLEQISGGGRYVTTNNKWTWSDSTPKYNVGDAVQVYYEGHIARGAFNGWKPFTVTAVSDSRNGGTIFREWTYTVESDRGLVLTGVYESCLKEG